MVSLDVMSARWCVSRRHLSPVAVTPGGLTGDPRDTSLPPEPLYQTYRATVITKEIRRQTVCRNISKASVDYAMDWTMRRPGKGTAGGSPKGVSTPVQSQSTLWQDLRAVQEAGVLEQLTPEQCKYQEVRREGLMGRGEIGEGKREMRYQVWNHILK